MNLRKPIAIVLALVLFGMIAPAFGAGLYTPGIGDPNYSISFSLADPTMTTLTLPNPVPANYQFWAYVWLNNATAITIDQDQAPQAGVGGVEVHINLAGVSTWCVPNTFANYVTGTPGIGSVIGVFDSSAPAELLTGIPAGFYNVNTEYRFAASTSHAAFYYTHVVYGATTSGLVAAIQFNVTGQPAIAQPDFVGKINFTADGLTSIVDAAGPGNKIMFDEFPATLTIPAKVPAAFAYPDTEPEIYFDTYPMTHVADGSPYTPVSFDYSAALNTSFFNVTVAIGNNKNTITGLDPKWDVAGFDVGITWNNTLINFVTGYEGGMLKSGGCLTQGLTGGLFTNGFANSVVGDNGTAEAVFTKTSDPSPSTGIDSLAIFEFQIVYAPPAGITVTCPITFLRNYTNGYYLPDLASWPHSEIPSPPWNGSLTAADMGPPNSGPMSWVANGGYPIPAGFVGVAPDAVYTGPFITPFVPGGYIDLYDQYPYPYGGQGYGQHSDSFSPQQNVTLYAKVTFNGGILVNKLVAFQINDASGQKFTVGQNYTDHNGIATWQYRIPQQIGANYSSCGMDPQVFGWWYATATVDIDQNMTSDFMWYQVGWLVQVLRVDITSPAVVKSTALHQAVNFTSTLNTVIGEQTMDFTVLVLTIHEQPLTATFSVDTYDVEGYPLTENTWTYTVNATRVTTIPGNTTHGVYEFGHDYYSGSPLSFDILPEYFHEDQALTAPIPSAPNPIQSLLPYWARLSPYSSTDAYGHASVIGYAFTALPINNGVPYAPQSNANDDYLPSNPLIPIDEVGYGTGTPFYIG